jgi:hypothetical protein
MKTGPTYRTRTHELSGLFPSLRLQQPVKDVLIGFAVSGTKYLIGILILYLGGKSRVPAMRSVLCLFWVVGWACAFTSARHASAQSRASAEYAACA